MIRDIDINENSDELKRAIDRFPETKVLVVGDIMMDEYIWGDVSRISPEAPVPVVEVQQETKMLGGAANVISNIHALGGRPILCGVIGNDFTGREIVDKVRDLRLITDGIITESERRTSIKTRVVAHSQQLLRFDRESRMEIKPESVDGILGFINERLGNLDVIVVEDYGKGVISAELMKGMRDLILDKDITLAVDPKIDNFQYYQGIDVITPNHHEAGVFCKIRIVDKETLYQAGKRMLKELNCGAVLITQGGEGMTLFENKGDITHIPALARKVFDVSGAGDTVIGTLCLGLASGMDLKSASKISNFAAGIVVGEVGTSVVRAADLKRIIPIR